MAVTRRGEPAPKRRRPGRARSGARVATTCPPPGPSLPAPADDPGSVRHHVLAAMVATTRRRRPWPSSYRRRVSRPALLRGHGGQRPSPGRATCCAAAGRGLQ